MQKTELPQDYTQATGTVINPALPQGALHLLIFIADL